MPEKTPADILLEREGGEIIPEEFLQTVPPRDQNAKPDTSYHKAQQILPPDFYEGPVGKLLKEEIQMFDSCYLAVKDMVAFRMRTDRLDAADFAQWEAGRRSPLEAAEPQIAIEVYRQIREEMRRGK